MAIKLVSSECILLLCDLQEEYSCKVKHFRDIVSKTSKVLRAARKLQMSIGISELEGMGPTVADIETRYPQYREVTFVRSLSKSGCMSICTRKLMKKVYGKMFVIICGFEADTAVKETALDLISEGFDVIVLTDACSSEHSRDRNSAFEELEGRGCLVMTTAETIEGLRNWNEASSRKTPVDRQFGKRHGRSPDVQKHGMASKGYGFRMEKYDKSSFQSWREPIRKIDEVEMKPSASGRVGSGGPPSYSNAIGISRESPPPPYEEENSRPCASRGRGRLPPGDDSVEGNCVIF